MPTWLSTLLPLIESLIEWIITEYNAEPTSGKAGADPVGDNLKAALVGIQATMSALSAAKKK